MSIEAVEMNSAREIGRILPRVKAAFQNRFVTEINMMTVLKFIAEKFLGKSGKGNLLTLNSSETTSSPTNAAVRTAS